MQEQLSASEIYTALETFALNDYARHTGFMKRAPQKITPKNLGAGFLKTIVKVMSGSPKQGESIGTGRADDDERKQARLASTQTLIKIPQQQGEQNAQAHQHGFINRHVRKKDTRRRAKKPWLRQRPASREFETARTEKIFAASVGAWNCGVMRKMNPPIMFF